MSVIFSDEEVHFVLLAAGVSKRRKLPATGFTTRYKRALHKKAVSILRCWETEKVPKVAFLILQQSCPSVVTKYELQCQEKRPSENFQQHHDARPVPFCEQPVYDARPVPFFEQPVYAAPTGWESSEADSNGTHD